MAIYMVNIVLCNLYIYIYIYIYIIIIIIIITVTSITITITIITTITITTTGVVILTTTRSPTVYRRELLLISLPLLAICGLKWGFMCCQYADTRAYGTPNHQRGKGAEPFSRHTTRDTNVELFNPAASRVGESGFPAAADATMSGSRK